MTGSLASCGSVPVYETEPSGNGFSIPRSLFDQEPTQIVRVKGLPYNVAVHRESDGTFTAVLLRCTHADNALTFSGSGYSCSLHGSRFDLEGEVTKGPAARPLLRYKAEASGGTVVVSIG